MRFYTTIFVFIYLFVSSMSANAWAMAFGKTVVGGYVVTKSLQWGRTMGESAHNYCKANKSKCKDWFGDALELFFGDDDNSNCIYRYKIPAYIDNSQKLYTPNAAYNRFIDYTKKELGDENVLKSPDFNKAVRQAEDEAKHIDTGSSKWQILGTLHAPYIHKIGNNEYKMKASFTSYIKCADITENDRMEKYDDFFEFMRDNFDKEKEDEILKHPANQPLIEKYCKGFGACIEMEPEFRQEYEKNKDDYDPDKFDESTCEMRNGKIKSCDGAKKDKGDKGDSSDGKNGGQTGKDKEGDDEDKEGEDKDKEGEDEDKEGEGKDKEGDDTDNLKCKDSDLTEELCEFLDWVDDEAKEPKDKDTKVDVEENDDKNKLDDDIIDVMKSCPADIEFSVTMLGQSMHFSVDTMPFCLVSQKVRPYIVGAGTLSAIFILAGVRRE